MGKETSFKLYHAITLNNTFIPPKDITVILCNIILTQCGSQLQIVANAMQNKAVQCVFIISWQLYRYQLFFPHFTLFKKCDFLP